MVTATAREEKGEFCVAVAPATRTAGILTQLVKGAGCQMSWPSGRTGSYTGLIGFNPRRIKALKGDELPRNWLPYTNKPMMIMTYTVSMRNLLLLLTSS